MAFGLRLYLDIIIGESQNDLPKDVTVSVH